MPKINEMLLKLEGFHYSTSLDLNMGYNHIRISKKISNLCTIILPWGKYCYKRLKTGIVNSPNILQQKMNALFNGFEFIRAQIEDILVLKKENLKSVTMIDPVTGWL